MSKGWFNDRERHKLSGRGVKNRKNMSLVFNTAGERRALKDYWNDFTMSYQRMHEIQNKSIDMLGKDNYSNPFRNIDYSIKKEHDKVFTELLKLYVMDYAKDNKITIVNIELEDFVKDMMKDLKLKPGKLSDNDIQMIEKYINTHLKTDQEQRIYRFLIDNLPNQLLSIWGKNNYKVNKNKLTFKLPAVYKEKFGWNRNYRFDDELRAIEYVLMKAENPDASWNDIFATSGNNIYNALYDDLYSTAYRDTEAIFGYHEIPLYDSLKGVQIYKNGNFRMVFRSDKDLQRFLDVVNDVNKHLRRE